MKRSNFVYSVIFFLLTLIGSGFAQSITGFQPFGTFQNGSVDSVNLANLNVHIRIPVVSKAGRIPFDVAFDYDSSTPVLNSGSNSNPAWTNPIKRFGVAPETNDVCSDGGGVAYTFTEFIDSLNTHHPLSIAPIKIGTFQGCLTTFTARPSDSSGITVVFSTVPPNAGVEFSYVVTMRDGTTFTNQAADGSYSTLLEREVDPNGNVILYNGTTLAYTDTLNVQELKANGLSWSYPDTNGSYTNTVTPFYSNHLIKSNFGCNTEFGPVSQAMIDSISLPDGTQYSFLYEDTPGYTGDTTGRIAKITLPTGGVITYAYPGVHDGFSCLDRTTVSMTRTTSDGTWTYTRTQASPNGTTSVTDPAGNITGYAFSGPPGNTTPSFEIQRQIYQGSSPLLSTVMTCYNGNFTNCGSSPPNGVSSPITSKAIYTTLGTQTFSTGQTFDSKGQLIWRDDYDWFNAGYPLLKETQITMAVNGSGACSNIGQGIFNRPCTVIIKDGTGATAAQTQYAYDAAGNPTQVQRLVSGSTYLTEYFSYDANGAVKTHTDMNGTVMNYTNDKCNNAFPSVISGFGLSTSATWDCNGGVQASFTDANSKPTTYAHNDPFWRLKSTTDPLSNVTNLTYVTGTSNYVDSSMLYNGSLSTVDITNFTDGLGRVIRTQQKKSPTSSSYDTGTKTYDAYGRLAKSTMPCTVAWSTDCAATPATATLYDALGRVTSVTDGGAGTVTWVYTNNDALQTVGPTAPVKVKQFEYDGLGRLTSVCEVTSGTGSGSCAQTSVKTGYWTKYTYNALGKLLTATQNAQATSQLRTFTYDDLGRLTSENNPEGGTVQYFYDSGATGPGVACAGTYNGDLVKKYDANTNTTCYTYDGLHRALSTTYSGPNSTGVNRYFVYESATVGGQTMQNAHGRLAEAYTAATQAGTKVTDLGFSYSPRGEQTDTYEFTPHSGTNNYYHVIRSYWANGSLQTLSGLGLPTLTYGANGQGQTSTVNASAGTNPVTSTTYNSTGQVTGVNFGSVDAASFTFDPNTGRMTQYKETINGTATYGTLVWNANGTPSTLAITDPFNSSNGGKTCTFGYDDLIRVSSTTCTGSIWSQTFTYDPFGNVTKSGSSAWNPGYYPASNHYSLSGVTYDLNGNLTWDTFHHYAWDVNGQVVSMDSTILLTYDALGRQVERTNGAGYVQYVYVGSTKLALMNGSTLTRAFIPLPGCLHHILQQVQSPGLAW